MFKKTDSLRKTLNISSWLSRLSRTCSPVIREEADGWVGTQETGSVCEFWILKLGGTQRSHHCPLYLRACWHFPWWRSLEKLPLFSGVTQTSLPGSRSLPTFSLEDPPVPLLCHFLFFPTSWLSGELWGWTCWNLGKVLRVSPSWKGFPPEYLRTKTSCAGSLFPEVFPRLPLATHGGQRGTTFAVQVRYQLNPNY